MKLAFALVAVGIAGSGSLSGQASNIFPSSGNVGIGTTAPPVQLSVIGKTYSSSGFFVAGGDLTSTLNGAPWYGIGVTNTALFGPVQAVQVAGLGGLNFQTGAGQMVVRGDTGNVGIGTTSPQHKLSVNGTIGAKEVIVTNTGWPDYVFKPGYRLRPLSEVAAYILANHHLPDIPSEAEVKAQGVSVGEMQAKLLAKIEELTLHMIREHERNDRLEKQNQELRDEIREIRGRIAR